MKLSKFSFTLDPSLIAQYPAKKREDTRLMVIRREKKRITHHSFKDLPSFIKKGDALVLNNSRVFPGQLHGYKEKTSADVLMILLRELDKENRLWDVCVEPSRKIRVGNKICIGEDLVVEVIDNTSSRCRTIKFCFQGDRNRLQLSNQELYDILEKIGEPPLPAMIDRPVEESDKKRYQTVYAKNIGSVVAPSAGFSFTRYLLKYLEYKGVNIAEITLHLGINTLTPLNTEDLVKCRIHTEPFFIEKKAVDVVNSTLKEGKRVIVVGTSTFKAVESSISEVQNLQEKSSWTSNFISPRYTPTIAGGLITGFHLPQSIDYINVLAFGGPELMMHAYRVAQREKYRFGSYGDACLIL